MSLTNITSKVTGACVLLRSTECNFSFGKLINYEPVGLFSELLKALIKFHALIINCPPASDYNYILQV